MLSMILFIDCSCLKLFCNRVYVFVRLVAKLNHRVSFIFLIYQAILLFATLIGPSSIILVVSGKDLALNHINKNITSGKNGHLGSPNLDYKITSTIKLR